MKNAKRFFSIILSIGLLLGTVSSLGLSAAADSSIGTYFELTYFHIFDGGDNTNVLEFSDSAFQASVNLHMENGSLLNADPSQMSVCILELPDAQPYHFAPFSQTMKCSYIINYYNPKIVGNYTMRVSFAGKQLYEPCHIDIPFSVVEEKETLQLTILNNRISTEPDERVYGRLTDSAGVPVSDKTIEVSQTANISIVAPSVITDADGNFSFALDDRIIDDALNRGASYVALFLQTAATDAYRGAVASRILRFANRLNAVWLDGDGSVLDRKYYYEGDEIPSTDKTPTKYSGEGDGYAFERWDDGTVDGNTVTFKPIGKKTLAIRPIVESWTYGEDSSMKVRISPATNPEYVRIQCYYKPRGAGDAAYTSVKPVDAGDYTVKIIRPEGEKFTESSAVCDFSIYQADPSYTVPAGLNATYGDSLSSVELPEGWAWDNGEQTVGNTGNHTFSATFTPADSRNYKSVTEAVEISVAKRAITITADNKESFLGSALEALTYTLNGETAEGDDLNISLTAAADNQALGTYDIVVNYTDNPNYDITAVNGTYTLLAVIEYNFENTDVPEWVRDSGENLKFTVKRNYDDERTFDSFTGIEIDGAAADPANYDAARGSVVITLKSEFLNTLSVGEHTLKLLFNDGEAETRFTVVKAESKQDDATPAPTDSTDDALKTPNAAESTSAQTASAKTAATSDDFTIITFLLIFAAFGTAAPVVLKKKH